ncbi:MAG: NADP-dependent phosphogluconate dehydrogenase [Saprospiraceae bacterium]|nr:NADP-dependent phosphogluconate dehydrogenase [Saprospiraceae bacterium]
MKADIGILGLGVMGKSLARNFASKGFKVAVYNLPLPGEENFASEFVKTYSDLPFIGSNDIEEFIAHLSRQRIILLMVKSGEAIDQLITLLNPYLEEGDIIIDAGNSFYKDTIRRINYLKPLNIQFVGMGVSGGEKGALNGPSIMPAGSIEVRNSLLPILQKIAAKADDKPCVAWMGTDGAGHFVKMVHNGIEYADMQILSEVYGISKSMLGFTNVQIVQMMQKWQKSILKSYLIEITIDILKFKDVDGDILLEKILDVAGHKGTGQWAISEAMHFGIAIPSICAAMNERIISGQKELRQSLSKKNQKANLSKIKLTENTLKGALIFSRICALAEGFHLMRHAAQHYNWKTNLADIAQIWRGGCIIRSDMLIPIMKAFAQNPDYRHLFEIPEIADLLITYKPAAERLIAATLKSNIACPTISASVQYYRSMHTEFLPVNLIQAQRDYFGAHTYKRIDDKSAQSYHTIWDK